jgi:hypothetical protein
MDSIRKDVNKVIAYLCDNTNEGMFQPLKKASNQLERDNKRIEEATVNYALARKELIQAEISLNFSLHDMIEVYLSEVDPGMEYIILNSIKA